jgi:hypothetical protein
MAKKAKNVKSRSSSSAKIVKTTSRNSPLPKSMPMAVAPIKKEVTHEMIAKRAYEIFLGGGVGDETANWLAAERELRG